MTVDELMGRLEEMAVEQDELAARLRGKAAYRSERNDHLRNAGQLRALADGLHRHADERAVDELAKAVPLT